METKTPVELLVNSQPPKPTSRALWYYYLGEEPTAQIYGPCKPMSIIRWCNDGKLPLSAYICGGFTDVEDVDPLPPNRAYFACLRELLAMVQQGERYDLLNLDTGNVEHLSAAKPALGKLEMSSPFETRLSGLDLPAQTSVGSSYASEDSSNLSVRQSGAVVEGDLAHVSSKGDLVLLMERAQANMAVAGRRGKQQYNMPPLQNGPSAQDIAVNSPASGNGVEYKQLFHEIFGGNTFNMELTGGQPSLPSGASTPTDGILHQTPLQTATNPALVHASMLSVKAPAQGQVAPLFSHTGLGLAHPHQHMYAGIPAQTTESYLANTALANGLPFSAVGSGAFMTTQAGLAQFGGKLAASNKSSKVMFPEYAGNNRQVRAGGMGMSPTGSGTIPMTVCSPAIPLPLSFSTDSLSVTAASKAISPPSQATVPLAFLQSQSDALSTTALSNPGTAMLTTSMPAVANGVPGVASVMNRGALNRTAVPSGTVPVTDQQTVTLLHQLFCSESYNVGSGPPFWLFYTDEGADDIRGPFSGTEMLGLALSGKLPVGANIVGCDPCLQSVDKYGRLVIPRVDGKYFHPLFQLLLSTKDGQVYMPLRYPDAAETPVVLMGQQPNSAVQISLSPDTLLKPLRDLTVSAQQHGFPTINVSLADVGPVYTHDINGNLIQQMHLPMELRKGENMPMSNTVSSLSSLYHTFNTQHFANGGIPRAKAGVGMPTVLASSSTGRF